MKKVWIIIVIMVCFILIATTKLLIDLKLAQNEIQLVSLNITEEQSNEPSSQVIESPQEDINEEPPKQTYTPLVLGKSTYKKNPVGFESYEDVEHIQVKKAIGVNVLTGETYESSYTNIPHQLRIYGLKDKELQERINQWLKDNQIGYESSIMANFSNILIVEKSSVNFKHLKINLVDGNELTIDDYLYDREGIKTALAKYIVKALFESFNMSETLYDATYSQESNDDLILFNSQLEGWTQAIARKYDKNYFDFYCDDLFLHLFFDNLNFINPIPIEAIDDYTTPYQEIDSLIIDIPICDIYPYVSIYDKYAGYDGIYENENEVEELIVGFEDFTIVNDSILYKKLDLEDSKYDYMGYDTEKIEANQERWYKQFEKLSALKDKEIIAIDDLLYDQETGAHVVQFYVSFDKNMPAYKKHDIYKTISKAYCGVSYRIAGQLMDATGILKNKYKEIDIYVDKEVCSSWAN